MWVIDVYWPVLLCLKQCKDTLKLVKCCWTDSVRSDSQLRVQLLTLGRRVKVQRTPRNDRFPLSFTQSISVHSRVLRRSLWEIVFSGMLGLWSLGVWTWKESNNKSVAGLNLHFVSFRHCCWPLVGFTFSLQIPSDWLRNPPHVGSFWSLATFFCVNISVYFAQMLSTLTVYFVFTLCETVSCSHFVEII